MKMVAGRAGLPEPLGGDRVEADNLRWLATPQNSPSASDYARRIGVAPTQISRSIQKGEIVPPDDGRIDVTRAHAT